MAGGLQEARMVVGLDAGLCVAEVSQQRSFISEYKGAPLALHFCSRATSGKETDG
jgi:hypothetical protein